MFRLHKHKSEKFGDRFDFKFSSLQALQVPKGWDKLFVSIISVETGKTVCKSGKATVRNGSCRWTDTLTESVCLTQHDSSKEIEECLFKFVVAMGSARSGVLGEVTVNLMSYKNSETAIPVSLPLKKCNHGTVLLVKVHCVKPRAKVREENWEENVGSYVEDDASVVDYNDLENKSDVSDSSLTRSVGSLSSNHMDSISRDLSFSASGSIYSFDSMEGSLGRENYCPQNSENGTVNNHHIGRLDSTGSQHSSPYGSYSFNDSSRSNHSFFTSKVSHSYVQNKRDDFSRASCTVASSPLRNTGSSKDLLEAAEVTIQELRAEARMWEQNARNLMTDMGKLQDELSDQSKYQENLELELSESHRECNSLKQEIVQLKILLEESIVKQASDENMKFQAQEMDKFQKELEDEVRFQKESNASLALQLKKTQESNIDLVSVLQELEDTVEKQKIEIAYFSKMQSQYKESGNSKHEFESNEEIKPSKQVFAKNITKASCDSDLDGIIVENQIGDLPAGFEPEDNRNLEMEVRWLQESQKNLESSIQVLKDSLEEKVHELAVEQSLKTQTLMDCEAEWRNKLAVKEEAIINLEAKLSEAFKSHSIPGGRDHNLIKEIEVLKQKIEDLEKDCNELTEENLELVLKLKESEQNLPTGGASSNSFSNECLENDSLSTSESEVRKRKSQICKLEEELNKKEILIEEFATDHLQIQLVELEKKCVDMEIQLQASNEKTCYLNDEICKYHSRAEELENEIAALRQLECYLQKETETKDHLVDICTDLKISESHSDTEMVQILSELHQQIQSCLANVKRQWYSVNMPTNTGCNCDSNKPQISNATELFNQNEHAKSILNSFYQLKDFFELKVSACDDESQQWKEIRAAMVNADEVQNKLEDYNMKENTLCTSDLGPESLQMKPKNAVTYAGKELLDMMSKNDKLKSDNLLKELEVEALKHCQRELENQISNVQNEKRQLEEKMEVMLREGTMTTKCLEDLRHEIMVLNGSMDSQVSANKILVKTSLELENSKHELEVQLSELEKENVQLAERICGLEAQLRYLTDERGSSRLELQNSESYARNLEEKIQRLESELEAQKVDMKQRLQDMQNRWLETQEECEYLKKANPKLQTTAESLMEECSLLQKSQVELRKQKMKLHEHCTVLEAELRESEKMFSNMFKEIEALEGKYNLMLEEIASKEKAFNLEIDSLLNENKTYKEKLDMEERLLNQVYLEKTVEVGNLQREVAHLSEQVSATYDEKERTASEAVLEVSRLRSDKAMLEASLQEVQGSLKLSESNLSTLQLELETKMHELMDVLAASKQNQEVLMADHEKLLELLEEVKSNEEKHKSIIRGLELKLKASEYERQQSAEEISSLKVQLQKTSLLQNEILALKKSLNELKFENQRLEASFQVLSGDYEELKANKILSVQKISDMEKAVSELEDCKRCKVSLEEKVLRLEGDLTAREALGAQATELKNEVARVKLTNSELQRKIRCLDDEKQEYLKRAQAFEEELKQRKEAKQDEHQFSEASNSLRAESKAMCTSTPDESKLSQVDTKSNCNAGSTQGIGIDLLSKNQQLENELAEALEANDMYKAQLKSLLSERGNANLNAQKKLTDEVEAVKQDGDGYRGTASSLETELRDLKERYLHMSLKYAEVEGEREQLARKLRAVSVSGGRRWFS